MLLSLTIIMNNRKKCLTVSYTNLQTEQPLYKVN